MNEWNLVAYQTILQPINTTSHYTIQIQNTLYVLLVWYSHYIIIVIHYYEQQNQIRKFAPRFRPQSHYVWQKFIVS